MYVFGIDSGSSSKTTSLWHVSLDVHAAGWQQIIVVGTGAAPRIKGQVSTSWSEGAASYNPVSRKAYVFGGWNVHFNELTIAADSGQLQQLEGRYWRPSAAVLCVRVLLRSGFNIRGVLDHMPVFVLIYSGACSCAVLQILRLAVGIRRRRPHHAGSRKRVQRRQPRQARAVLDRGVLAALILRK